MFFTLRIFSRGKVRFNPHRDFGNGRAVSKESYSSVIPVVSARDLIGNLDSYHEIIDVRTPTEHGEDNILNTATNLPVLSDQERVEVGTLYSKDTFRARKIGAALISRNIHKHILENFLDKDKSYRPLIYCWRGGQRSRSLAMVLQEIGFQPTLLAGGYKEYRRLVRAALCDERDPASWPHLKHLNFIRWLSCYTVIVMVCYMKYQGQRTHWEREVGNIGGSGGEGRAGPPSGAAC